MKKNNLLYITTSLMVLSSTVQADNAKVQADDTELTCEQLGYTVPVSECLEKGTIPLLCPFATGETDDVRMSLCYSESCRGFPLWKEKVDGAYVYYHLDRNGNKVIAAPETGHIGDYIEGGEAALLSCKTGLASDARTYYKVKKCIDGAILDYDICANGCGKNKYPYDKHPGDLAGAVASCEDEEGEHFGYTSCNDGWVFTEGQCVLAACDIKEYPYMENPNLINGENRGETKTCRIGGNIYYKYVSCDTDAGFELKSGACIKRCELQNCTSESIEVAKCIPVRDENGNIKSYNSCTYNNWKCEIASTCRIGDYITYDDKDIAFLIHKGSSGDDKNLAMAFSVQKKAYADAPYDNILMVESIPGVTTLAAAYQDFAGKEKTLKFIKYEEDYTKYFPIFAYAYDYTVNCEPGTPCALHEWYVPSLGELEYIFKNRYILYNASTISTLTGSTWGTSTQGSSYNNWNIIFSSGKKYSERRVISAVSSRLIAF